MPLDIFIGVAGAVVTALVVAAMILIAPGGTVPHRADHKPAPRDAAPAPETVESAARADHPATAAT
jgi:hypothetical protein